MSIGNPRVLIVSWMTGSDYGGSEYFWSDFIRRAPVEWEFGVFYRRSGAVVHAFVELEERGVSFFFQDPGSEISLELANVIAEFEPDLVWINLNSHIPHRLIVECEWPAVVPKIIMVQAVVPQLFTKGRDTRPINDLYSSADLVTFCTERNLKDAERILGRGLKNAAIIGNYVDCAKFAPTRRDIPNDTWTVTCVARLAIQAKGQDVLLEALSSPELMQIRWRLNLVGNGPDRECLHGLAGHYGVSDRVTIYSTGGIPEELSKSDLFVLPSNWEGLSFALLEAMASAVPCVVSDIAGQDELVHEAECGWSFSNGNPDSLKRALLDAWNGRNNRETGMNGREYVLRNYEISTVMKKMFSHVEKCLAEHALGVIH